MAERYSNLRCLQTLILVITCLAFIQTAFAAYEFDIYRLVAFEQSGKPLGSKVSSFSLVGTHYSGDLLRKLALIHFSEVTNENINEILNKKPSGLLLILPNGQSNVDEAASWRVISENLVAKSLQIPIYFCEDNDVISHIYEKSRASITKEKTERHHGIDSSMNFIVNAAEPKLLKSLALEDFYGVLDETTPSVRISPTSNPVILVVASYDSFTHVPDAKLGLNEFSSGSVALLNVAKVLSEFYDVNKETNYNVLFFLTSSKSFNYEGLDIWIKKAENSKIINRIEYAILLDSVAAKNSLNLYLYNGETAATDGVQNAVKNFEKISQIYGVPVQFHQANTNIFVNKFPVLKVTDRSSDSSREWINSRNFNLPAFKKNVILISEFLVSSIYGVGRTFRVLDDHHLNQEFLEASLSLFESRSTFPPQIVKDSPFTQELYRVFSEVVKHPLRATYTYSNPQFYTSAKAKLKITRINSAFFDLYLLIGNIAWLSILYLILSQTKQSDGSTRTKVDESKRVKAEDAKRAKSPRRRD